ATPPPTSPPPPPAAPAARGPPPPRPPRNHTPPPPTPPLLPTPILGQLGGVSTPVSTRLRQDNIVYKLVLPTDPVWDNLLTINAQSTRPTGGSQQTSTRLDTHLEIYNVQGHLIAPHSTPA